MGPQPSAAAFRGCRYSDRPVVPWSNCTLVPIAILAAQRAGDPCWTRQCQLLLWVRRWLACCSFRRCASRAANMSNKIRVRARWLVVAAVLALAQSASVTVQAQSFWNWNQQDQYNRQQSRPQSGGFFDWFGGGQYNSRPRDDDYYRPPRRRQYQHTQQQPNQHTQQQPSESSRAPPPKKAEAKDEQIEPTTTIVVMGDDMADWLGYGLEDVLSDTPEIRVVRKNKLNSGLLHYDAKGDLDWWHVARDTLAQEKADYVVMIVGTGDRQAIRVKDLAKEADTRAKDQQAKDPAAKDEAEKKDGQKPAKTSDTDENGTPSAQRAKKTVSPA